MIYKFVILNTKIVKRRSKDLNYYDQTSLVEVLTPLGQILLRNSITLINLLL